MQLITLVHRVTEQVVHVHLVEEFLSGVADAADWIEEKAQELVEAVTGEPIAEDVPAQPVPAEPIVDAVDEQPSAAIEIPAEAAAIAADPVQGV